MILPTMNDDEKVYEAFRVVDWLNDIFKDVRDDVFDRFSRGTRFPYIQRYLLEDDKMNKWHMLFVCPNKAAKKKGICLTMCYTIYEIPPKYKEKDLNSGKGVIIFDFVSMKRFKDDKGQHNVKPAAFMDIVPHAFNRYTDRYLKPKGKENIEFQRKVESIILRWRHFDVLADMYGDKNAEKHKDDGICPYDVFMAGGGMLRGNIVNNLLIRFNTYVSDDQYYENQIEREEAMMKEREKWKREGIYVDGYGVNHKKS